MMLEDEVARNIRSLSVQGATNVARAVVDALSRLLTDIPDIGPRDLEQIGKRLSLVRPTEPLAQNAVRYIFSGTDGDMDMIRKNIMEFGNIIDGSQEAIRSIGFGNISDGETYLTHCHASSVTGIFLAAHAAGKQFSVIATETRPLFQGHRTVRELLDGGLTDITLIVDSLAAWVLADSKRNIRGVFVGADLLSEHGFVNKVGTYAISLAARNHSIPLYCVSTLLKYDPAPYDPSIIERRDPKEVWQDAPRGVSVYAPAFDYTPYSEHIRIITESGIIEPADLQKSVRAKYPFVFSGGNPA